MTDYANAKAVDFDEIPVIDVSGLGDPAKRADIARALVETAKTIGFFYVSGHGIAPDLRETAFAASERFFALPDTAKDTVRVDQNQRGWMAQGKSNLEGAKTFDAKEVFFWGWDIAPDDPDLALPLVARNQWPDDVAPWLQTGIAPYYNAVVDLGRTLLTALAEGLGADPAVFQTAYTKPLARGQLVCYRPVTDLDRAEERFSAAAHSDFGVLTLLAQDDLGGLQVRNMAGDWIAAPPIPNTYVCNIGDLLELWTGGALRSTLHRVQNTSGKQRFSIPVFCDPGSATVIDPADLMGGDPTSDPITAGAYIAGKNRSNFSHYKKP